jgi:hypothetical protein
MAMARDNGLKRLDQCVVIDHWFTAPSHEDR